MSAALLCQTALFVEGLYHAVQAVEKYLKALALSISDPAGRDMRPIASQPWIKTHNLAKLADRCGGAYPYYVTPDVTAQLQRFSEYDQAARYPWVERKYGTGFSMADLAVSEDLFRHLRNDIPIIVDDYPLGILVRGHHHGKPSARPHAGARVLYLPALAALRGQFRDVDSLVRW